MPDIRESPVFEIVRELKAYKIDVYGYDPLLSDEMIEQFGVKLFPGPDLKMDDKESEEHFRIVRKVYGIYYPLIFSNN